MFLTKFDAFGEKLVYSTLFGGSSTENQAQIGLDGAGNPHIAGFTSSTSAVATPGAAQTKYGGTGDFILAAFEVPLPRWRVLGNGLRGSTAPNLAGAGTLAPGSTTRLSVRGGVPGGLAWFVAGLVELQLPLFGGVLHPSPDVVLPVSLDSGGALDFTFPWPSNGAVDIWFQLFQLDTGAPFLLSATNALRAVGSN
jgi:hypothetical protein